MRGVFLQLVGSAVSSQNTLPAVSCWAPGVHGQVLQEVRREESRENGEIPPPWESGRAPWGEQATAGALRIRILVHFFC